MILYLVAGAVSFASVFIKGFQHKNIAGNHYKLVFFTSYAMAISDVLLVGLIAKNGWAIAFPCGTGAAFGIVLSMYIHNRFVKPKDLPQEKF